MQKNDLITIRNASHKDVSSLLSLIHQLGFSIDKQDLLQNIELFLHTPEKMIWVAEQNQQILGCLALQLIYPFHMAKRLARITTLVVDEKHRRKKIAATLIQKAEEFAQKQNCEAIEVTSDIHRKKSGAHLFYKTMNYHKKNSKIYFRKELSPS